ncbi:MAG: hypothetical protein ABI342_07165 [Nitrososphaera sp.]|jgi:hypothetical protein
MGIFDIFGKQSKKERQREQIDRNRRNGKAFEDEQDAYHRMMGHKVEKLRKGPDRKITRTDFLTGRKSVHYEEYKSSSTAPLRPSQKEFIKKHPNKMKVIRPNSWANVGNYSYSDSMRKTSKRNSNYGFGSGVDNMFGFGSSNRKNGKYNNSGFGSGLNDMFGSGSSGRKKRKSSGSWGF